VGFFRRRPSRSGRSFGAVAGIFLLAGAASLLTWNENRAVAVAGALSEGGLAAQEAPADRVDPALEGKLVHVAGELTVPAVPADPDFPALRVPAGTVRLQRLVETYQTQEVQSRGGSISYRQVWFSDMMDSAHTQQPGGPQKPQGRYRALRLVAPEAALGAYRLDGDLLRALGGGEGIVLADDVAGALPDMWRQGNTVYVGQAPQAPQIGDQRLAWEAVHPGSVGVIARQRGAGFVPYKARTGASVYLIAAGRVRAGEMIVAAEEANGGATWFGRFAGAGLTYLSLFLLLRWLVILDAVHPKLSAILDEGAAQAAAVLTLFAVPVVIAAAWLWMQVTGGAVMLAAGAACIWLATRLVRARQASRHL